MKKFIPLMLIFIFLAGCSLVRLPNPTFGLELQRDYSFELYDGQVLTGSFQGVENNAFFLISNRDLYRFRRGAIKRVTAANGAVVTKKMLNYYAGIDVRWEEADHFVDLYLKRAPSEININLAYVSELRTVSLGEGRISLSWQQHLPTSKRRRNLLVAQQVERRTSEGNWHNLKVIGANDTEFIDEKVQPNTVYFYRICQVYNLKKPRAMDIWYSYSPPQDGVWWVDGFYTPPAGSISLGNPPQDVYVSNHYSIAPTEVSVKQYCSMLNFALGRRELSGDYTGNITVTNREGSSQELVDLDDPDCPVTFTDGVFCPKIGQDDLPMREVTWYGAVFYCFMFNQFAGQFIPVEQLYSLEDWSCRFYNIDGYRLPTEAEWEYATRGAEQFLYSWGSDPKPINTSLESVDATQNPDITPHGLYHATGNVSEWTADDYTVNPGSQPQDPVVINGNILSTVKGGDWQSGLQYLSRRRPIEKTNSLDTVGFRIIRIFPEPGRTTGTSGVDVYRWDDLTK